MSNYDHKKIESKWQKKWREEKIYRTEQEDKKKKKFYALDMFPYPSGAGLHVGHPKGYIATDITARMKAMRGYSVLHPMGWDAFGLPAENYAIKNKIHPRAAVEENIKKFKNQLEKIGFTYDWEREINTIDPEYYRWTQWIFLKMFEKGLAYQSYEPINWCPGCQTGLANEDLEDGKCERCGSEVEKRPMRQWVLKMTAYADRLLEDLKLLDWDESIIEQQRNWIGRSEGAEVEFRIANSELRIGVFTTRPDTLFGCTYIVVCPEYEMIKNLESRILNLEEVKKYVQESAKKSDLDRTDLAKEKTGVELKGIKAINPVNNEEIPVWVADYVLAGYGTGAIMAVPAHDERDFEFAKKYGLEIRQVVQKAEKKVVFIHGCSSQDKRSNHDYIDPNIRHWQSYIINELERKNFKVYNPIMPSDWKPNYKEWKEVIEKFDIDENTILIGTSGGGAFLVRWLGETKKKINKLILVAPFKYLPKHKKDNAHLKKFGDFEISKDIKNRTENIIVFISNDLSKRVESAKLYVEILSAKLIKLNDRGHFNIWDNPINKKFPELLEEILIDKTKTPERNSEDFGESEDSHPRYKTQTCHFATSINDNKNVVKGKNSAEPAEGFEPSDLKMTSSGLCHIAGSSTPDVLYQNNKASVKKEAYAGDGVNVNSDFLNGLETGEAKKKMIEWLGENNFGKKSVNYKMRDWVFSRQRYWGEPIPIIHCEKCGAVAVPEDKLPVKLPEVKHYEPTGTGESPLANIEEWVNTTCPKCGGAAKRETNTMPQWAGSSWYYLRYLDPKNKRELVDKEKEKYWMKPGGVDLYVGGAEHATRHLLYARFWHKFLYDIKVVSTLEPFHKLFYVGLILAEDGRKMSKRWGNVINPDEIIEKFGADSLRLYEMFMGPFSQATVWNTSGLVGMRRFLEKIWELRNRIGNSELRIANKKIERLLHKTIKKVTEDIEDFKFNTAVSQLMILVNEMEKQEKISSIHYSQFLILLSPFAPHIAEELWEKLGNKESIYLQSWPKYDPELIKEEEVELVVQINGKLRDRIKIAADITEEDARKLVLESEKIKKWIEGKEIRKFIFVRGKLVNIVV